MHMHHAHRHACMCFHVNMSRAYCRQLLNQLFIKFERKILKIGKVIVVLIEFLNSSASPAPTCMHFHEK